MSKRKGKGGHISEINALRVLDGQTVVDRSTGQRLVICVPSWFNLDVIDGLAAQTLAASGPSGPGNLRWYAALTREQVGKVRVALARDDGKAALAAAYNLGRLARESEMVLQHGDAHITGAVQLKRAEEIGERSNAKRRAEAAEEHERWIAEAGSIWARRPSLSATKCAERVIANLGLSVSARAVRRVIAVYKP